MIRIIKSRDVPDAFFYLDPPYVGFSTRGIMMEVHPGGLDSLLETLAHIK